MRGITRDITARKQAEIALSRLNALLQREEGRLRMVLNNLLMGIMAADEQRRIIFANDVACGMLGYPREDLLAMTMDQLHPPEVAAQIISRFARAARGEEAISDDIPLQRSDGSVFLAEIRNSAIEIDGRPCLLGLFTDVSERRQTEQALARSLAALEQAQALTQLGSWRLDFANQRMEWSKETYRINGMEPGTPVDPQTHHHLIHPDDFAAYEAAWQATLNGAPYDLTHRNLVKGELKWVHTRAEILYDDAGRPQTALGTLQDVTARKLAELALTEKTEALRQAEQQLRGVLDTLPVGVVAVDLETRRIHYANENLCRMLGREREGVVAMSPLDAFPAEHRAMNIARFENALRGEAFFEPELPVERLDGTQFTAEIRNIQAVMDGHRCLLGVFTDITERIRHEQALRQAREAAEAANRAKSEFLAHMSHEIRTPLNAVLGLTQVLDREPLTPNQTDVVGRIHAAGQSLLGIINDVLDLSKIEAGQLRLESRPFDLEALLTKLDGLLGQAARAKGLTLRRAGRSAVPGWLLGDGLRLEQIASLDRQRTALITASARWRGAAAGDRAPPTMSALPPPAASAPLLDAEQLAALRQNLRNHDWTALRGFEALKPALAGVLGETTIGTLDAAIQGLRFAEALALLDQTLASANARDPPGQPTASILPRGADAPTPLGRPDSPGWPPAPKESGPPGPE